ncbi:sigma-70 family RNA polymerase sigma factor [Mucilaginibacter galii]|uniref:RNA polymerase sigma-70 region 2 domain-containing protein n=1 Tax=Mucilaginibacter galii TaxID=2005073 RepID=A0A917N313_9SPHI|nr:sigma-70 family RNA polymerase sigma factor [Mucilaginibacter galii]GGI52446.1 hypothetical protein GCM10011425_36580 [Mucilaginibacter galii]
MSHEECKIWTTQDYDYLYLYAQRKLKDKEIIKDLIQETFLVALQNYQKFENRSSETTWLTAILKYKIYRVYRCQSLNKVSYSDKDDLNTLSIINQRASINNHKLKDHLVAKEFIQELNKHLKSLPVSWQQVYELKYVQDLQSQVIFNTLHISQRNYWVITHRLKSSLKKWYITNWQ